MRKQSVEFAITRKNGIITRIGRTSILQPKTKPRGGSIRQREGKPKQAGK